jgi:hypothetical protein
MTNNDLVKAIKYLKPDSEFVFDDSDYSTIQWHLLEGDAPTFEQVQEAHLEIKRIEEEAALAALNKKAALLEKLSITEDEAKLLLS